MIKNGQSRDTGNTGHTRYKTMTIKTKQTKNNKQKRKNTNTIQKAKKISNMDPTKIAVLISISPKNVHLTYYEEE